MTATSGTCVSLYNPLPRALAHYELALREVLETAGRTVEAGLGRARSIELGEAAAGRKLVVAVAGLWDRLRLVYSGCPTTIVCWPALGLAEPAAWRPRRGRRVLVVEHDPRPLRRQRGMGKVARLVGRGMRSRRTTVLAHTRLAAARCEELGVGEVIVVPHPIRRPAAERPNVASPRQGAIVVLGQFKAARALKLMTALGAEPEWAGRLQISGRGWPPIVGWLHDDRFLEESELDDVLDRAAAVLIPYQWFFQSGIAVRALERGVPVVGPRHEHLIELFGAEWPGLVEDLEVNSWSSGLRRILRTPRETLEDRHTAVWARTVSAWREVLAQ